MSTRPPIMFISIHSLLRTAQCQLHPLCGRGSMYLLLPDEDTVVHTRALAPTAHFRKFVFLLLPCCCSCCSGLKLGVHAHAAALGVGLTSQLLLCQ